jgi:imidazole glycerol phosphate synthase subunit HisF
MLEVTSYLREISNFINKVEADRIVVNLITGWVIPKESEVEYPFLLSNNVSINTDAVTLADVVEREIVDIKSGLTVVVILADNRQHSTKMEYFKCKISSDSTLSAVQIVNSSTVKFYEGGNYHGEDVL